LGWAFGAPSVASVANATTVTSMLATTIAFTTSTIVAIIAS